MNTFSDDLRKERVTRNISLSDIASKTRINVKYLEAIEQGSFDILPQTYVRAFLSEYAEAVGLPSPEILKKYDVMVTGKYSAQGGTIAGSGWGGSSLSIPEAAGKGSAATANERDLKRQRLLIWTAVGIPVVAVVAWLFNYAVNGNDVPTPHEIQFQDVIREQEQRSQPTVVDSTKSVSPSEPAPDDSLTLRGNTTDSVWVSIVRDGGTAENNLLPPNVSHIWRAKEKIVITLGNAGGISFTLNGKNIGVMGRRGTVLRDISLTASSAHESDGAGKPSNQK